MKKLISTCSCICFLLICTKAELMAAPPQVIAQGSIKPLQSALQELEAYVIEAVKGTPQAAFVQPGSLTFLGPMMLGLPPGLLNMGEGVHIYILNDKDLKKAPSGMIIPILQDLKNSQSGQLKPQGDIFVWKTKKKSLYLAQAGKGFASLSENQNHAKTIADYFMHQQSKPVAGKGILNMKVHLDTIFTSHKDEFFAEFDKSMKKIPGQNAKMAKAYLTILKESLAGLESFDFSLNALNGQLNLTSSVTTLGKGDFAEYIQKCTQLKADYSDTAYLSADSAMFGTFQWDASLNKNMMAMSQKFILPLLLDEAAAKKYLSLLESSAKLMNGPMTFSNFTTSSGVSTQTFFPVSDGDAYLNSLDPVMTATTDFINALYKNMELPMTLSLEVSKEKTKVAGLEVQKISYDAKSALPTGLENMNQFICNDKNTIFMVTNTSNDSSELNELIQAKRSKQGSLSKREGYAQTLESVKNQKIGFMAMYPIDYIKVSMEQAKTNAGIFAGMLAGFDEVLKKLPNSKHTMTFGFDAPSDKTISMNMNLPAPALQELMMAGMAIQQHFMANMTQNKQSASPQFLGKAAPKASTTTLDGKAWSLADQKGKVVLIDFWATWCGPCVHAMPEMKAIYEKYKSNPNFLMVGTAMDRQAKDVQKFVTDENLPWLQLHEPGKDWDNSFSDAFQVNSIPSIWIIDQDGVVRGEKIHGKQQIEAILDELLK